MLHLKKSVKWNDHLSDTKRVVGKIGAKKNLLNQDFKKSFYAICHRVSVESSCTNGQITKGPSYIFFMLTYDF